MLVIRQAQMSSLQELPRRDIENRLILHFAKFYPRECSSAGEAEMRRLVGTGLQRAAGHGFLTLDTATLYVNLMIILGWGFDADPQLDWARAKLRDYSLPPGDRIRSLFDATLDYLGAVAGENGQKVVRAMLRIRKHDFLAPWTSSAEAFDEELLALLSRLYPTKAAIQGDEVNRALLRRAREDAARHGFTGANAIAAYTVLEFMLGAAFDTDPLYWWAGATLQASATEREEERLARLIERALKHTEASLKGLDESDGREE